MAPAAPEIARSADRCLRQWRDIVLRCRRSRCLPFARRIEGKIDLRQREAGQFHVEVEIDQSLQFDRQQVLVPARIQGELVVGQDVGPAFGFAHVRKTHRRHLRHAERPCRQHPAMAGDDGVIIGDQHRVGEAEAIDAVGDLADLPS